VLRVIAKHHELVVLERELSVGAAVVIGELDLKYGGAQVLDHGADLSAVQALVREIDGQSDDVEYVDGRSRGRPLIYSG
jgi:hypothetical protein